MAPAKATWKWRRSEMAPLGELWPEVLVLLIVLGPLVH